MSNINVPTKACSIGPTEGLFYYIDNSNLISVNSTGDVVSYYIKSSYTDTIEFITFACSSKASFDYDGTLVFTAEIGPADVTFRRWILDLDTISLREIKSVRYSKTGYYSFDIRGFSVEKYVRTVSVSAPSGQIYIYINDTTHIRPGQECIIGPSTIGLYINNLTFTEVDYIDGSRVYLKDSLDNSFAAGNYITFVGDIFVSSATGISNGPVPLIYVLDSQKFFVKDKRALYQVRTASSSDFNDGILYLCSDYCTYFVDIDTYKVSNILYSYQRCNGNYKTVYGIIIVSDEVFYTLQKDLVTFSNFNCSVENTGNYNLVTNSLFTYINSSQITFGSYVSDDEVNVIAKVLDQFAIPVYNITVTFKTSDADGSFSVNDVNTNVSGEAFSVYTIGNDLNQTLTSYTDSTFAWRSSDYVYGNNYIKILGDAVSDGSVFSYGDVVSSVVETAYSNTVEFEGYVSFLQQRYEADIEVESSPDIDSDGRVVSVPSESCENVLSLYSDEIDSNGLVFNTESAYINDPLDDSIIVSIFDFLSYFLPECGSVKNPRGVVIDFFISPQTYAFDVSSFSFEIREINGVFNYDSGIKSVTSDGEITLIDLGGSRYAIRFVYSPEPLYKFSSRIYCYLKINDIDSPSNLFRFNCRFDIIPDYISPIVISTSPMCGATDVPKDIDIYTVINDVGTGVDPDSIEITLDGIPVVSNVYTVSGGYSALYHPVIDFNPGSSVSLNIKALDCSGNLMSESCKFYIEESNAPDIIPENICADVVDNRFSFFFDIYDTGGGVKFDSVKLFLDNKLAEIIVRPIVERIR